MMNNMDTHHGFDRPISQNNFYNDVVEMYNSFSEMIKEFSFQVLEQAVDTGKVSRDLYSTFWDIVYAKHFDGEEIACAYC